VTPSARSPGANSQADCCWARPSTCHRGVALPSNLERDRVWWPVVGHSRLSVSRSDGPSGTGRVLYQVWQCKAFAALIQHISRHTRLECRRIYNRGAHMAHSAARSRWTAAGASLELTQLKACPPSWITLFCRTHSRTQYSMKPVTGVASDKPHLCFVGGTGCAAQRTAARPCGRQETFGGCAPVAALGARLRWHSAPPLHCTSQRRNRCRS
jgi:hypothetical protein